MPEQPQWEDAESQPASEPVPSQPQKLDPPPPRPPGALGPQSAPRVMLEPPKEFGPPLIHDSGTTPETPPPTTQTRWYGWQTLITDGAALLAWSSAVSDDGEGSDMFMLGAGFYLFGAPIVHAGHGHAGKAFGSLGLRVGAPFGGALVGALLADDDEEYGALEGAVVGFGLGMLAAVIIDSAAIAREEVPVEPRRAEQARVFVTPTFAVTKDRAAVGVVGSF